MGEAPPLVGVAVKVTLLPLQAGLVPDVIPILTEGVTVALIVKLLPLSVPVVAGLLLTTLILYPLPVGVAPGIVAAMVPLPVEVKVPILVGLEKLPLALLNCAVKTFPGLKVPVAVKGTFTAAPEQKGDPETVPVEMLLAGGVQLTVVVVIPGPKMVTSMLLQFMVSGVAVAQLVPPLKGLVDVVSVPV